MREIHTEDAERLRSYYRHFARVEAAEVSPRYAEWAAGLAADDDVVELLMRLPAAKRQPNLVFAAARVHGAPLRDWTTTARHLTEHWEEVATTIMERRTQTNEAGRIAVLNYAFSRIAEGAGKPLALVEVGASAGLTLYPDAWPIRYISDAAEDQVLAPRGPLVASGQLECRLEGLEAPPRLPEVGWRAGVDLNPLDLRRDDDRRWLEALVWPGMEHRVDRLTAGAELLRQDPPQLFAGDLNERLAEVLARVPAGTVPVVFHSAVLVYLAGAERARFVEQLRSAGVRWVSNEGVSVLPEVAAQVPGEDPHAEGFILALDGEPLARTGPHGQYLRRLAA